MKDKVLGGKKRYLVISDLHFGDQNASLTDKGTIDLFFEEILDCDKIDEIILLGDIFDFWVSKPIDTINASKLFFNGLKDFILKTNPKMKVIYISGNHDPQVHMRQMSDVPMQNTWNSLFGNIKCEIYPKRYVKEIRNNTFYFMHGHHLDRLQQILTPSLSVRFTTIPININGVSSMANKVFRYLSVKDQYPTILQFIENSTTNPNFFIYGHTHRAGAYFEDGGVVAINSGSWVEVSKRVRRRVESNTYLVIDDRVTIKSLGEKTINKMNIK